MSSVQIQNDIVLQSRAVVKPYTCQNTFQKVENVSVLEPILKDRLPNSANVFNMCKNQAKWSNDVTWFVLGGEISSNSWIVATYIRDDYGLEISVSRPAEGITTLEIREAFSKACFIDWSKPFVCPAIDPEVSKLISEISIRDKGNYTHISPFNLYCIDIEDGLELSEKFNHSEGVELKTIDNENGREFILNTWKYSTAGSDKYLKDVLHRNPSIGVYVNGKIVSGSVFSVHGLISMLYTLHDQRGKGYARSNMHLLMKTCAEKGLIPACTVARKNETANIFQERIGFKLAGHLDCVVFEAPEF